MTAKLQAIESRLAIFQSARDRGYVATMDSERAEAVERPAAVPYLVPRIGSAAFAGELCYQRCGSCGRAQLYPRPACTGCGAASLEWRRSEGRGTVHAVTVVYRPPSAAFKLDLPYAVALVALDEGLRMMANIVGGDPEEIAIGDHVTVTFERRGDLPLPQFTRASDSAPGPRAPT